MKRAAKKVVTDETEKKTIESRRETSDKQTVNRRNENVGLIPNDTQFSRKTEKPSE